MTVDTWCDCVSRTGAIPIGPVRRQNRLHGEPRAARKGTFVSPGVRGRYGQDQRLSPQPTGTSETELKRTGINGQLLVA